MKRMFSVLFVCLLIFGALCFSSGCEDVAVSRGTVTNGYKVGNELASKEYESISKGIVLSIIEDVKSGEKMELERVVILYKGILDNQKGSISNFPPLYQSFYFAFYNAAGRIQSCQVREEDWETKKAGDLMNVMVWTQIPNPGLGFLKSCPPQFQSFPQ